MSERYTIVARVSKRSKPNHATYNEGDVVTGDQLRYIGADPERLLATGAIKVCEPEPKATKPEPEPKPVEPAAEAPKVGGPGRKLVSDG